MSFLTRDELDKYLDKLPRHDQVQRSAVSTKQPGPQEKQTSTLRGPRPPVKPAAFRSSSISCNTTQADTPPPAKSTTPRSYNDLRDDLVYPIQQKLNLNESPVDAFEEALDKPRKQTSTLRGPRPTVKPAAFHSSSITRNTTQADMPPPAKPTTPRSYKDICDDITYRPNEMNLNESPEVASDKPKKHSPEATKNEKNPLRETHLGARVSVPNVLYTGVRCAGCDKAISGMTITAAGQVWHAGCFKCQHCKQDLEHVAFYTKDGRPYCALDYHELFSTRCDYCGTPIEEKSIQALGKYYHEGHFFCRECGKPFDETDAFMVHDGHPYCEVDYLAKFGHKCMGCGEYITGEVVSALDGEWHKQCFVCTDCGKEFTSATFYVRNNRPFCEEHYRAVQHPSTTPKLETVADRKTCHRCGDAIEGRSASAFGKEYHTTHFQCALCDKVLSVRVPGMWQEGEPGQVVCISCARVRTR